MKTVGKQLEEGRLAKQWTPELAARETKIRVERVLDLESDNFENFSSPTYARGFVRTYARALSLDEYRLLRQLDQKLPESESTLLSESGVVYIPQTTEMTPQRPPPSPIKTSALAMYFLCGLVLLVTGFVLYRNYEESQKENSGLVTPTPVPTPQPTPQPDDSAPKRALPVNGDEVPPIPVATTPPVSATPKPLAAQPVGPVVVPAPVAPTPIDINAIPVAPAAGALTTPSPVPAVTNTPAPSPQAVITPLPSGPVDLNSIPVARAVPVDTPVAINGTPVPMISPTPTPTPAPKALELTARGECYVSVSQVDSHNRLSLIFAKTLETGDVQDFDGTKFVVKMSNPGVMDISVRNEPYTHSADHGTETLTISTAAPTTTPTRHP